ncbi:acyl-CoA dehydrogenase [Gordonia sp. HNM0687]|uniref:Acyl-CoA dehydrogenase n=1 Tax=Gordonia mangrovi TaxID=2665643 RepID=A0A6L7GTU2_9ACTN|nr:acyl-CoA dehydrogenase family protein [Gordonia mangrovi]MXP23340.1 acyl-CoA dehydrogenase [Gordonia mangrovi]UVF76747.1 acyl-CoA dehydrogenase family protein [Gordonia mangrovi]
MTTSATPGRATRGAATSAHEPDSSWRERLGALLDDFRRRPRPATSHERFAAAVAWQSELVDAGLAAPGWPEAVGGLGLDLTDQLDYYRMMTAAGAPKHPCSLSFIVAPTLIVHGTDAQRQRYLEPLLRADEFWCQGFSEPGAGSDLASLSTRAVREGDHYRVTGQKIWTTMADRADWMFALVRTGEPGRGTSGVTYLLIAMDSPGVEVRPLRDAAGGRHFAEVFFDDVVVPVANRVGDEGGGWSIMRTSLGHERATAFLADEFKYRTTVDKVVRLAIAQGYRDDALVRQRIAELETDVATIATNSARALGAVLRGEDPGSVASINRLVKSEFEQRMHRLALRLTGPGAVLGGRSFGAVDGGRWTHGYMMTRASTIGAGTAEIQRNTIAESVLGLPSHRGEGRRAPAVAPGRPLAAPDPDEAVVRETVADMVAALVAPDRLVSGEVDRAQTWMSLVDFGLPGLAAAQAWGGGGAPLGLLCAAVEEAAYHLAPVPLVPTISALALLTEAGAQEHARRLIDGERAVVVVATDDAGWRIGASADPAGLVTIAEGVLSGTVGRVVGAPDADVLVVLAREADSGELVIAVVEQADVQLIPEEPLDLTASAAQVNLDGVTGTVVASGDTARRASVYAHRVALLMIAADSVGVAARAVAMAVDWAGQREQFGRPIGEFQAVSHRCADMLVDTESARNQVQAAAAVESDPDNAEPAVLLAAAQALSAAVRVTESCIQVHGGIGFTWEHPAHLLLRRALSNEACCARPEALRDQAAEHVISRIESA